jgi:hypothetical protein
VSSVTFRIAASEAQQIAWAYSMSDHHARVWERGSLSETGGSKSETA